MTNNKFPSFQFYPSDWFTDAKLQACDVAAQGLLVNMMCLMHQSEKYGFLLINGEQKCDKILSKLLRISFYRYKKLIKELLDNGVLKVDKSGVYYCQRMVKDHALRQVRREAGRLGGNPNLLNQTDNPIDNQGSNQISTPSSSSSSSSSIPDTDTLVVSEKSKTTRGPNCPYEEIRKLYNEICGPANLRGKTKLEPDSKAGRQMLILWKKYPTLEWWRAYFIRASAAMILRGETDSGWRGHLEFLTRKDKMTGVWEGIYDGDERKLGGDDINKIKEANVLARSVLEAMKG